MLPTKQACHRLWGGIHPPIDDIPGRIIGEEIGSLAFIKADALFDIDNPALISASVSDSVLSIADIGSQFSMYFTFNVPMDSSLVPSLTLFGSYLQNTQIQFPFA